MDRSEHWKGFLFFKLLVDKKLNGRMLLIDFSSSF